jgi:hypothetical protein
MPGDFAMTTHLRFLLLGSSAVLAALTGLRGATAPGSIEIPFTCRLTADDLAIERVEVAADGKLAQFAVYYRSKRERNLALFDPPSRRAINELEREALQPGAGVVTFDAPLAKVRDVPAITLRFWAGDSEADANFVFLDLEAPAVRALLGPRRAPAQDSIATARAGAVRRIAPYTDIRWKDASSVAGLDAQTILGLTFNESTRWSVADAATSRAILQDGMNPGLGVRRLHAAGITGAGVSVGIIDQNLFLDHPQFADRIARYVDLGCKAASGSMHGPAVASLLAGKDIGTAPGARVYFAAAPSLTNDAKYFADALLWLVEINATLPPAEKIRVVSVSEAPSGAGTAFSRNNALWDAACARAEEAGMLVLDCTEHRGLIAACYCDLAAPDDFSRVSAGCPGKTLAARADRLYAPAARRTVAEEYAEGEASYQFAGVGAPSWSIPYAAGVLALGWQVNPQLPPQRMIELLRATAYEKDGLRIINPAAFIAAVKHE